MSEKRWFWPEKPPVIPGGKWIKELSIRKDCFSA
jgi:hypothetical protein